MLKPYLECGRIVTTHGVHGEVKAEVWMDSPEEMTALKYLYLKDGEQSLHIQNARVQKKMVILKLEGYETPEEGNLLRGKTIYAKREDIPLPPGKHFLVDLIGCKVIDADDGHEYGTMVDYSETGANRVYHIKFSDGSVQYIPVIPDVVILTDPENGVMLIRPLPGLFDDGGEDDAF